MIKLSKDVIFFLEHQGFCIVSTIDKGGSIHCAAKGLAGIDEKGEILIIDLYRTGTFNNLQRNPVVSVTAVDEHKFCGYTLKGKGRIVERAEIEGKIIKNWETRVLKRVSKRLITNIKGEKKSKHHPELVLPKPEYMIVMEVEEVTNLTPHHLRKK
jgi:general stress protein 26